LSLLLICISQNKKLINFNHLETTMIGNAFSLSILSVAGIYFIWKKLPQRMKDLLLKYPALLDVAALVGTYLILGGSTTALMAGAMAGLFTSILIHIGTHKEDFMYLWDIGAEISFNVSKLLKEIKDFGQAYSARVLSYSTSGE